MKIAEVASAEDQLALWRVISDNTWRAINAQAEQERRAKAERAARSKSQRPKRGVRRSSPKAVSTAVPAVKPDSTGTGKSAEKANQQPSAIAINPAPQQPQSPSAPKDAMGQQPQATIKPTPTVASSSTAQSAQQTTTQQTKPRIMARAGGLTS
jgi:hypothetical protein